MNIVMVTGMSGAGKSTTMKMLEDMGYYCIDNLPIPLLPSLVNLTSDFYQDTEKVAVGIDIRNGKAMEDIGPAIEALEQVEHEVTILFLEASDDVLVKRYKETRRNHPLARDGRIETGITEERKRLAYLKQTADYILDTSRLLTRELRAELEKIFVEELDYKSLFVTILSFGFKYGIPEDSDLVFDVRFLPNPYYVPELRPLTGNDQAIQDYVLSAEDADTFLDKLEDLFNFLLPRYISEGKSQLVISIGCTGGKHRSVTLANELYKRLAKGSGFGLKVEHRDIAKDAQRGK